jgi:cytochrome c-type biogenesis protein
MLADLLLALTAGMLAAVNPCGFALLPAYLSILVLGADQPGRATAIRRALVSTGCLTLGFVAVFGIFGLVVAPVASGVQRYLPWVTLVLGLLLVLAGIWLLAGRSLPVLGWSPKGAGLSRRFGSMVAFGVTYALASLTCTIAPFLAVVVTSFRSGSVLQGAGLFVAYGVGMGLLVGAASLTVALAQESLITRLRRFGGVAARVAGLLLVLVGAYVAYYGWWELRVLAGGSAQDGVVGAAAFLQGRLSATVAAVGVPGMLLLALGLLVLAAAVVRLRRGRSGDRRDLGVDLHRSVGGHPVQVAGETTDRPQVTLDGPQAIEGCRRSAEHD